MTFTIALKLSELLSCHRHHVRITLLVKILKNMHAVVLLLMLMLLSVLV